MPKGMTTVNKCGINFESFIPFANAFNPFSIRNFSDFVLECVANSSCMPCPEVTLKHVVNLYASCIVFSSGISLEIKITPVLISPALAWAANKMPNENTLGFFYYVSNCVDVIRIRVSHW